jgi:hypothetical protein
MALVEQDCDVGRVLSGGVVTAEALQQQCAACGSQMFPLSMSVFAGWLHVHLSNNPQQVVELRYQQLTIQLHPCLYLVVCQRLEYCWLHNPLSCAAACALFVRSVCGVDIPTGTCCGSVNLLWLRGCRC